MFITLFTGGFGGFFPFSEKLYCPDTQPGSRRCWRGWLCWGWHWELWSPCSGGLWGLWAAGSLCFAGPTLPGAPLQVFWLVCRGLQGCSELSWCRRCPQLMAGLWGLLHTHTGAELDRAETSMQSSETEAEAAGNPQQLLQDFCTGVLWVTPGVFGLHRGGAGLLAAGQGCEAQQPLIRSPAGLGAHCFSFKGRKNRALHLGGFVWEENTKNCDSFLSQCYICIHVDVHPLLYLTWG